MKSPQKILLFIIIAITSLFFAGIAVGYYYWRQLTQLPDWYSSQADQSTTSSAQLAPAELNKKQITLRHKLQNQIQAQLPKANFPTDSSPSLLGLPVTLPKTQDAIALKLDNRDLQQVLLDGIARNPKTQPLLGATRGFKTTITDQSVAIGTVINSREILKSSVDSPEKQKIQQFFQQFPQFKDRDLSIQLEGRPTLEQGTLILDDQSTLTIGTVRFSIAELAQRLGISTAQIRQFLTIQANADRLQAIQLKENQMTLEIAPSQPTGDN